MSSRHPLDRLAFALWALGALVLGGRRESRWGQRRQAQAFDRHDGSVFMAASLLFAEAELEARRSPKPISAICISMVSASPETMFSQPAGCIRPPNRANRRDNSCSAFWFDKGYGVPQDWVQAEVWLNLAAAHAGASQQEYFARVRDAVAQKLTARSARRNPAPRVCLDANRQPGARRPLRPGVLTRTSRLIDSSSWTDSESADGHFRVHFDRFPALLLRRHFRVVPGRCSPKPGHAAT